MIVIYYEINDKMISLKKTNDNKLNLKQKIIRYFIEPACGSIKRDEYETRGEPGWGLRLSKNWEKWHC